MDDDPKCEDAKVFLACLVVFIVAFWALRLAILDLMR